MGEIRRHVPYPRRHKSLALAFHVSTATDAEAQGALYAYEVRTEQLPADLAGWWKLDDPRAFMVRDLVSACSDGATYRRWEIGGP